LGAYHVCRSCNRHVRAADRSCPFCGAPSTPRPILRWLRRTNRSGLMAFGSTLAMTGCSESPGNRADGVDASYVVFQGVDARAEGAEPADDAAPLAATDNVSDAAAVTPALRFWPDAALADAALGTHVAGGFVCVNPYPSPGFDPPPSVCDPRTQYCCDYNYSDRPWEGCHAFGDAGPFSCWPPRCSCYPPPSPGSCTCQDLDDAGAVAISCGSCYGSPPARREPSRSDDASNVTRRSARALCLRRPREHVRVT
jgi:hypothetical protein